MDPATLSLIATLGSGAFGFLTGNRQPEIPLEQRRLMDEQRRAIEIQNALARIQLARRQAQDPLWRAVQQMAFSRLPVFAKAGLNFDLSQPAAPSMPREAARPRNRGENPVTGEAMLRRL